MLVVRVEGTSQHGSSAKPLENRIVWRPVPGSKQIIAVGGPSDWVSSEPLPADAVSVDLIRASTDDPAQAKELWSRFLAYVDLKENRGTLHALKRYFVAIPVLVEIADPTLRSAVVASIRNSKAFRVSIQNS